MSNNSQTIGTNPPPGIVQLVGEVNTGLFSNLGGGFETTTEADLIAIGQALGVKLFTYLDDGTYVEVAMDGTEFVHHIEIGVKPIGAGVSWDSGDGNENLATTSDAQVYTKDGLQFNMDAGDVVPLGSLMSNGMLLPGNFDKVVAEAGTQLQLRIVLARKPVPQGSMSNVPVTA